MISYQRVFYKIFTRSLTPAAALLLACISTTVKAATLDVHKQHSPKTTPTTEQPLETAATVPASQDTKNKDEQQVTLTVVGRAPGLISATSDVYKNAFTIGTKQLSKTPSNNIVEAIKKTPISIGFQGKKSIDLRGQGTEPGAGDMSAFRVHTAYNGIPIESLDKVHEFNFVRNFNIYPTNNLVSVNIIPGGGSVLYGNGTEGGTIDLQSNFTLFNPVVNNYICLGAASFDTYRMATALGAELVPHRLFVEFNFSGEVGNGYLQKETKSGQPSENEHHTSSFSNFFTKIKLTDNQSIGYSFIHFEDQGLEAIFGGGFNSYSKKKDFDPKHPRNCHGNLNARNAYSGMHQILYQGRFDNVSVDNSTFYYKSGWNLLSDNPDELISRGLGNQTKVKIFLKNSFSDYVIVGLDLVQLKQNFLLKWDPDYKIDPSYYYKRTTIAPYFMNYKRWGKFFTTAGYRLSYDRSTKNTPNCVTTDMADHRITLLRNSYNSGISASMGYDFTKSLNGWVSYEHGFSDPALEYLSDTLQIKHVQKGQKTKYKTNTYLPNDLKPEEYNTFQVGSNFNLKKTHTTIKWDVFYTLRKDSFYHDIIDVQYNRKDIRPGTNFADTYDNYHLVTGFNAGKATNAGFEVNVQQDIGKYARAYLQATNTHSIMKNPDVSHLEALKEQAIHDQLPHELVDKIQGAIDDIRSGSFARVPKWIVASGISVFPIKNVSLNADLRYVGAHSAQSQKDEDIARKEKGKKFKPTLLPAVTTVDVSMDIAYKNLEVSTGVNNVFNAYYFTAQGGSSLVHPNPGRNYFLNVKYKL